MISYSEIKKGERIIIDNSPYEVIQTSWMFKGRGHSVLQAKIKNLKTGEAISKTFHPSDSFEEAEISKITCKFLYGHRDSYFFSEEDNPGKRFSLTREQISHIINFLKPNETVDGIVFDSEIINISLPIKVQLKVKEAPPGLKGDRAQGGNKLVVLETGGEINVPLFVKEGDIVEINTESGEYVRRIEKK